MDFVKDNNPKHLNHAEGMLGNFPKYVKSAYDVGKQEKVAHLHKSSFANPIAREFPIDTEENTFLSYAYYKSAGVADTQISDNIKVAAARHNIDLVKLDEVFAVKEASDEDLAKNFAISIDVGQQGVRFYYPLHDELAIEKSARDLAEDFDRIPLEAFRHAALNLVKAAKSKEMPLSSFPDRVRYTGAHREFNRKFASQAVRQREKTLGKEAASIYGDIIKSASLDTEHVNDYVNLFLEMDNMNGIKYAREMLNPYEAFFSGHDIDEIEKTANSYVVVSEAPIPISEFTDLAKDKVEKDFAFEERELLLDVIKTAAEAGGIAASEKIVQFPNATQRRLLQSLAKESLPKYAAVTGPLTSPTGDVAAPGRSTSSAAGGANPLDLSPAPPSTPASPPGGPVGAGPAGLGGNMLNGLSGVPNNFNLGTLGADPFTTGESEPQSGGAILDGGGPQASV
jgi:hypothetical protein